VTVRLLVFDDELLSVSKSGSVWGRIYFDLGDRAFPDKGWSDLAVAVATAWLEALIQLTSAATRRERVHFMDGPLAVDVSLSSSGSVNLDFIHNDTIRHSAVARIDELLQNAVSSGDALLAICKHHGWSSDSAFPELIVNVQKGVEALARLRADGT
jgi:hypothetical protein